MGKYIASIAAGGLVALMSTSSHAVLQISANVNGSILTCADGQACDTSGTVGVEDGQLSIANQTLNGVTISGSNQFQQIGSANNLNTSSFQIVNNNLVPVNVTVAVSGTDYAGPVQVFNATGSGSWQNADGSTIDLTFYADTGNTQGADTPVDLPGVQLASFSDTAVGVADSFSNSFQGAFVDNDLYSMSLGTTGTLAAWNGLANQQPTLVGRNQALVTLQEVPEPASLAILGSGLLGMGAFMWFRRRKQQKENRFDYSNMAAA